MSTTARFEADCFDENEGSAELKLNTNQDLLFDLIGMTLINRTPDQAQPGSPADGDAYLLVGTPTGLDWDGNSGKITTYHTGAGWRFFLPEPGMVVWLADEKIGLRYDGSVWIGEGGTTPVVGITASTVQTQGQMALTADMNEVATVANPNDVVTLPPTDPGRTCTILMHGANDLQVYPPSGAHIDEGATDASKTLGSALAGARFHCFEDDEWISEALGAELA